MLAVEDALTGGGIVGGVMSSALALYVLWDKVTTRREKGRETALAADKVEAEQLIAIDKLKREQHAAAEKVEIEIAGLADKKVAEAWDKLAGERKEAHERDVKFLRDEINANRDRLESLERRERECQATCEVLKSQNAQQAREMAQQAAEMRDLRENIARLEQKLKAAGALPGTGERRPLTPPKG